MPLVTLSLSKGGHNEKAALPCGAAFGFPVAFASNATVV
jgi:hypothetical protein